MKSADGSPANTPIDGRLETGSLVTLRVALTGSLWRPNAGWFWLAGLVTVSGVRWLEQPWLMLALVLVLVEVLWGAVWAQLAAGSGWVLTQVARRPMLPYVAPSSPAASLLGWNRPGFWSALVRQALPAIVLALLVSAVVGWPAVLATSLVAGLSLLGAAARAAGTPALGRGLHALVQATVPFMLAVALAGARLSLDRDVSAALLVLGYTLVSYASLALDDLDPAGYNAGLLLPAGLGAGLLITALLLVQAPVTAGVVALLAAAPLLIMARQEVARPRLVQAWWLAVVLVSALGLGMGLG